MTLANLQKPAPRFREKADKRREAEKLKREVYRLVDVRDQFRCRCCGRRCRQTMEAVEDRWEHHHVRPRSLEAHPHTIANVMGACLSCHSRITRHEVTVTGNAQQRLIFSTGVRTWDS